MAECEKYLIVGKVQESMLLDGKLEKTVLKQIYILLQAMEALRGSEQILM